MKRTLTLGILVLGCYMAFGWKPAWDEAKVAILVTYAKRHVANGGIVLHHLPNVTIAAHPLKKGPPLFLLGEDDKENPLRTSASSDGKGEINTQAFVNRLHQLLVKHNATTPLPQKLVSDFDTLDLTQIKNQQKVLEIFLREEPVAPMGQSGTKSTSDAEKKVAPVQDSILVQIGPVNAIKTELDRMKDQTDTKYLYEKHFHAIPLKVSLFQERAGTEQEGPAMEDWDGFYVVKHKTLEDTPELVIPNVRVKGELKTIAYKIPHWQVGTSQTDVEFSLPASAIIDGLITTALDGNVPTPIVPDKEHEADTACRKDDKSGQIVIQGVLPLANNTKAGSANKVTFHMDDVKDATVLYRGELTIGVFAQPDLTVFKKPGAVNVPSDGSKVGDLK